jgi:hypothetical protein
MHHDDRLGDAGHHDGGVDTLLISCRISETVEPAVCVHTIQVDRHHDAYHAGSPHTICNLISQLKQLECRVNRPPPQTACQWLVSVSVTVAASVTRTACQPQADTGRQQVVFIVEIIILAFTACMAA